MRPARKHFGVAGVGVVLAIVWAASVHAGHDQLGIYADETATRLSADTTFGVRAAVGDLDGDNDLDVLVPAGLHTGGLSVTPSSWFDFLLQINDGSGTFTEQASSRLPSSAFGSRVTSAAVLGDIDRDADLDVFVANGNSFFLEFPFTLYQNLIWTNDGTGAFTDETGDRLPGSITVTLDAAMGDVDGDGDLDILEGNVGFFGVGEQNRLLINDGTGQFVDETSARLPSTPDITLAVDLADVDLDSDLDIVVANGSPSPSRILINDGSGVFTDESSTRLLPPTPFLAADVKVTDLDRDGSADLMFAVVTGGPRIFINDGAGVFTDETATRTPTFPGAHGLALADVDGDQDADAFVSTPPSPGVLLLNDGAGVFSDATTTSVPVLPPMILRYPVCGDVDADGDPDLYLPSWNPTPDQDRLLINQGDNIVLLEDLTDQITGLGLSAGAANPLLNLVNAALARLEDDNPNNDTGARAQLRGFVAAVEAKAGKSIDQSDAQDLIEAANRIMTRMEQPAKCVE